MIVFDQCFDIVTEPTDQESEINHIEQALYRWEYPKLTFNKVKDQIRLIKENKKEKKDRSEEGKRILIVILYIKGITEQLQRVYKKIQGGYISQTSTGHTQHLGPHKG